MTDAWLMEADCIHGVVWYECRDCEQPTDYIPGTSFRYDEEWTNLDDTD